MSPKDNLGNRIKAYEHVSSTTLTRRLPTIIRVDGKAFHTYTKGLDRPWDEGMVTAMGKTACALVEGIQGCKIAYVQSDEISLLLTDDDTIHTDAWFDKKVQKMVSISAAMATYHFNRFADMYMPTHRTFRGYQKMALFDSRVFTLPPEEVNNYFLWRQNDATRNSVSMLAQSKFSHKELQGKNSNEMQEMLHFHHGMNWNDLSTHLKRGWCCYKVQKPHVGKNPQTGDEVTTTRTEIIEDREIPIFSKDREFVLRR